MSKIYQKLYLVFNSTIKFGLTVFLLGFGFTATAQCPANIDFEFGDFTNWQCWTGNVLDSVSGTKHFNVMHLLPSPPTAGRHTMLSQFPGNGRDQYGNFPQNCPNGSGHSIKLGNNTGGAEAEGVSYTFTIPAGQDKFSLIYNYAVVFQDPGHLVEQQPRLEIDIKNLTDNTTLGCSSFAFIATGGLPGFFQSLTPGSPIPVWCKNWSATSINLDGYAGKTIQLFFKTSDCTFSAHFGYAYIDVNTECSSSFVGATFCPDDTAVNITAPFGYQTYRWYNNDFSQLIGSSQTLNLNPPPLAGDSVFVELTPYAGYGCLDTLSAKLWDTLTIRSNAGPDQKTCDNKPVQLGGPPEPGRLYKWTPATGLSDPTISNPIATPSVTTTYTLTVTNNGGGCATPDQVKVTVDILSDSIQQVGPSAYCTSSGQSVYLKVLPHDSIQWYRNGGAIPGATQVQYNVTQSGAYYAMVFSYSGCNRTTAVKQIDIWESPVIGFSVNNKTQCNFGNQFIFTNTSTLGTGTLQYAWNLGDGTLDNNADVTHTYAAEGNYKVKLLITAPGGCADSSFVDLVVNASPTADFAVDIPQQCFKNNWFIFSNKSTVSSGIMTYAWDFGDGNIDYSNDIAHKYATPGTYLVKLTAKETNGGCTDDSTYTVIVNSSPVAAFGVNANPQCFPGHQFVFTNGSTIYSGTMQYSWDMGDGVNKTSADVTYSYAKAGNYTVKLLLDAAGGCKDSAYKDIIVHPVPAADFTIQPVCVNLQVPVFNRTYNNTTSTVNYLWDFGNGHTDNVKSPVYSYPAPGMYPVSLSVSTAQCPVSFNTKTVNVIIEGLVNGIRYADIDAAFNFPETLRARPIGSSALWTPATNLDNRFSFSPVFKGLTPQLYTVQLKTPAGCITVDTQMVKTHKKIEIYVPTGFTPDGNGVNERLRPVLIGFTKVNYFRIYDRWGKMLFSMNNDLPGWDGKINGSPASTQTVVWMIEAVDVDGVVHNKQGTTILLR